MSLLSRLVCSAYSVTTTLQRKRFNSGVRALLGIAAVTPRSMPESPGATVFISFRVGEALPEARRLKKSLEDRGYPTFVCDTEKEKDNNLRDIVIPNIMNSKLVVVLGTENYAEATPSSVSTLHELRYVIDSRKPYVLVKMCEEFKQPEAKFTFVRDILYLRWRHLETPSCDEVVDHILQRLDILGVAAVTQQPKHTSKSPRVELFGVSLRWLQNLVATYPYLAQMSMREVCNSFVKRSMGDQHGLAYVDILQQQQEQQLASQSAAQTRSPCGPATCFVSFAWTTRFADLIDALQQYEYEGASENYYVIDVFTRPQLWIEGQPFEWWLATTQDMVQTPEEMLLVTDWRSPEPFTRAWILFEYYLAIAVNRTVKLVTPSRDLQMFKASVVRDPEEVLAVIRNMNLESAQTARLEDRAAINARIGAIEHLLPRLKNQYINHFASLCRAIAIGERASGNPQSARRFESTLNSLNELSV